MINAIQVDEGIEIWTDTEIAPCDGRCIADGPTLAEAKRSALLELAEEVAAVQNLEQKDVRDPWRFGATAAAKG